MANFIDGVIFVAAAPGIGDFVVAIPAQGFMTPAQGNAVDGVEYNYRAESADLTQWEIGYGVYTAAGTTLSRTKVLYNSFGTTARIDFAHQPNVGLVPLSRDFANIGGTPVLPATTIPLVEAGTGAVGIATKYAREDHVHPLGPGGGGGASVSVGVDPPPSPKVGDLWWDSSDSEGVLYVFYKDQDNTQQWVEADGDAGGSGGGGSGGANVTMSDTAPAAPKSGDLWWETDTGLLYIAYKDPDNANAVWVLAVPSSGGGSGTSGDPTIAYAWQLGMRGDGTTDNSAIFQTWSNGLPAQGGRIIFGPGKFLFSAKVTLAFHPSATGSSDDKKTFGSIIVEGSGSDLTTLYFPNSDGLDFQASSFQHTAHVRNLSITTGVAGGRKAIRISCTFGFFGSYTAQHDIDGATIRGDDGYGAVFYWDRCVDLYNITSVNFDGNSFYGPVASATATGSAYGIGVYVDSVTPSTEGSATTYNFTNNNFVFLGRAFYIGTDVQAFSIGAGNHILNGCDGIYVAPGGSQIRQLNVIGTEISVNGDCIYLATAVSASIFANNYIAVAPSKNGIVFAGNTGANSMGTTITGNVFVGKDTGAGDGIYVSTNYAAINIIANNFLGLNTGIELTASSSHAVVQDNAFLNCNNDVIDLGSSHIVGDGAWRTFTPTVTAGSGSFTSVTGSVNYKRIGRTVFVRGSVTITTNGTAASYVQVSLPIASVAEIPITGSNRTTGAMSSVTVSGAAVYITKYDGTYPAANGSVLVFNGSYETA